MRRIETSQRKLDRVTHRTAKMMHKAHTLLLLGLLRSLVGKALITAALTFSAEKRSKLRGTTSATTARETDVDAMSESTTLTIVPRYPSKTLEGTYAGPDARKSPSSSSKSDIATQMAVRARRTTTLDVRQRDFSPHQTRTVQGGAAGGGGKASTAASASRSAALTWWWHCPRWTLNSLAAILTWASDTWLPNLPILHDCVWRNLSVESRENSQFFGCSC